MTVVHPEFPAKPHRISQPETAGAMTRWRLSAALADIEFAFANAAFAVTCSPLGVNKTLHYVGVLEDDLNYLKRRWHDIADDIEGDILKACGGELS